MMITIDRDIKPHINEDLSEALYVYKKCRKNINIDDFSNNILNKDGLGDERIEIYSANRFLESAFNLFKGKVSSPTEAIGMLECLYGYEFNVYIYKVLKNYNAKNLKVEVPINIKKRKTVIDVVGSFDSETSISFFSIINDDLSETPFNIPVGYHSFEAKAMAKVSNDDIKQQLKIAVTSNKFTNTYGVVLSDTSVSRSVIKETKRIGSNIIRANNMSKEKIINNIVNIFGLCR